MQWLLLQQCCSFLSTVTTFMQNSHVRVQHETCRITSHTETSEWQTSLPVSAMSRETIVTSVFTTATEQRGTSLLCVMKGSFNQWIEFLTTTLRFSSITAWTATTSSQSKTLSALKWPLDKKINISGKMFNPKNHFRMVRFLSWLVDNNQWMNQILLLNKRFINLKRHVMFC